MSGVLQHRSIWKASGWIRLASLHIQQPDRTKLVYNTWINVGSGTGLAICYTEYGDQPPTRVPTYSVDGSLDVDNRSVSSATDAEYEKAIKPCGCSKGKSTSVNVDRYKRPTDDCWICAEKHLSTAYSTYMKEHGYRELNRWHYIGSLNDAENHLAGIVPDYVEVIRKFRHDIQYGMTKSDSDWQKLAERFYTLKGRYDSNNDTEQGMA